MMEQAKEKVQNVFGGDKQGDTGSTQGNPSMLDQVKEKVQHAFGGDNQGDTGSTGTTKESMQQKMSSGSGSTNKDNNLGDKAMQQMKGTTKK